MSSLSLSHPRKQARFIEFCGREHIDESACLCPTRLVLERLRVNISTHISRGLIKQNRLVSLGMSAKPLVNPTQGNTVDTTNVAHRWVATTVDDHDHGLVVLMKQWRLHVRTYELP